MAASITELAAKVTADMTGFRTGLASGRGDIASFKRSVTEGGGFKIPGMDGIGSAFKGLAAGLGPIAGLASIAGLTAMLKEISAEAWKIRDDAGDIGISTTLYQQLAQSARMAGEDMNTVGGGVVRLHKLIGEAARGSKEAEATLTKMGLASRNLVGMTTEQQLQAVATAISGVGNMAARTALEMEIFGKSGKKLDDILKDLADGKQVSQQLIMGAEQIDAMADASQGLGNAWQFIKTRVGDTWGTMLQMVGFGRTAEELAAAAKEEAVARAKAADEIKREADEAARLKAVEESRKKRTDFSADIDKQLAKLRGQSDIEKQLVEARKADQKNADKWYESWVATINGEGENERASSLVAAAEQARKIAQDADAKAVAAQEAAQRKKVAAGLAMGPIGFGFAHAFLGNEVEKLQAEADKLKRVADDARKQADEAKAAVDRRPPRDATDVANQMQRASAIRDEMATKADREYRQLMNVQLAETQRTRAAQERAQAESEAAAAVKASMTDAQKHAEQLKNIAAWQRQGIVSGTDADRMRNKAQTDLAKANKPNEPSQSYALGSTEEYSERVRLMNEARNQADVQKEEVAKEQLEEQKTTNTLLEEAIDILGQKPGIWKD